MASHGTMGAPSRLAMALVMGALVMLPTRATAGEPTERTGPYLRLYTGLGVTAKGALRIRQPARGTDLRFEPVSWEHRSLTTRWTRDSIPYMGVRAGFWWRDSPWLSLSFEALHFKVLARTDRIVRVTGADRHQVVDTRAPLDQYVQRYQVTNGVNMFMANVETHRGLARSDPFPSGRVDVYAGAGAGLTVPYTSSSIGGKHRGQYEAGRIGGQLFGGVAWRWARRWDVSLEYKRTMTVVDGQVAFGDSRSTLHTNHLALGFAYHLGP